MSSVVVLELLDRKSAERQEHEPVEQLVALQRDTVVSGHALESEVVVEDQVGGQPGIGHAPAGEGELLAIAVRHADVPDIGLVHADGVAPRRVAQRLVRGYRVAQIAGGEPKAGGPAIAELGFQAETQTRTQARALLGGIGECIRAGAADSAAIVDGQEVDVRAGGVVSGESVALPAHANVPIEAHTFDPVRQCARNRPIFHLRLLDHLGGYFTLQVVGDLRADLLLHDLGDIGHAHRTGTELGLFGGGTCCRIGFGLGGRIGDHLRCLLAREHAALDQSLQQVHHGVAQLVQPPFVGRLGGMRGARAHQESGAGRGELVRGHMRAVRRIVMGCGISAGAACGILATRATARSMARSTWTSPVERTSSDFRIEPSGRVHTLSGTL